MFKIVYYGPGMSGKTTNLVYIYQALSPHLRGDLVTLDTDEERTLFFDFFPLELGEIEGYKVRFNIYTIPGQVYYEASRRLMLDGADGVVFVADSHPDRFDHNIVSYQMMEDNLLSYNIDPSKFPLVFQHNKRDLENATPIGEVETVLGIENVAVFEAVARNGEGVMETIRGISRKIINEFKL